MASSCLYFFTFIFLHGGGKQLGVEWPSRCEVIGVRDSGAVMGMGEEGKRKEVLQKIKKNTNIHCCIIPNGQKWKQPKCQSKDEWINKIWLIHKMEYYSAV